MVVFPNAKINIGLNIVRRCADGYHDIESVFLPVDWCDILEITPAQGETTTLSVTGRGVDCPPEKNLVMKAYRRLAEEVNLPDVDIHLHKIIPDGAGLGGGSADAAFTLRLLNEMFALDISKNRLAEIAATIGADCPFFIYDTPMVAEGIGDRLTPVDVDLSDYRVAIVKPPVHVSTKEAYAGVTPEIPDHFLGDIVECRKPCEWLAAGVKNDFEPSIFAAHPQIAVIKRALLDLGAEYAAMTGSGASVIGLFKGDNPRCDNLAELFSGRFPDAITKITKCC